MTALLAALSGLASVLTLLSQTLVSIPPNTAVASTTTAFIQPQQNWVPSEKEQVRGKIRYFSSLVGFDEDLAIRIAECESRLDRFARNPSSTAKSYFQFLDGTWKYTMTRMGLSTSSDVFDEDIHINAGVWLLKQDGTRHWQESKNCWG